jgi:hypothetical protein
LCGFNEPQRFLRRVQFFRDVLQLVLQIVALPFVSQRFVCVEVRKVQIIR